MKTLRSLLSSATVLLLAWLSPTPAGADGALDIRYFIAGGTCAAISHGITTPVDVVKTRIQAQPDKYDKGMLRAAREIVKTEGPGVLLAGLGPTVVGYGLEGSMKFGVYEVMKPIFKTALADLVAEGDNMAVPYLLASVVAGAVAALLLCPMESTRIRIVTDPAYADKGLLTGLPKLIQEEGLWSTFSGLWAMLAKQVPYTFGKQVSFDVFAGMLYAFFHSVQEQWNLTEGKIKWAVSVVAAFLASLVACIFSQPGDMILTETYRRSDDTGKTIKKGKKGAAQRPPQQGQQHQQQRTFTDVVSALYVSGGLSAFFTGTGARIVHVGLIITSQLVIYDVVKQLLGLPATGSH